MFNFDKILDEQMAVAAKEKVQGQYEDALKEAIEFDKLVAFHGVYIGFISEFYPEWFSGMIASFRDDISKQGVDNFLFSARFVANTCETENGLPKKIGCEVDPLCISKVKVTGRDTEFWNMLENFFIRNGLLVDTSGFCGMKIGGTFKQFRDAYYNEMQALPFYEKLNDELYIYDGANPLIINEKIKSKKK